MSQTQHNSRVLNKTEEQSTITGMAEKIYTWIIGISLIGGVLLFIFNSISFLFYYNKLLTKTKRG